MASAEVVGNSALPARVDLYLRELELGPRSESRPGVNCLLRVPSWNGTDPTSNPCGGPNGTCIIQVRLSDGVLCRRSSVDHRGAFTPELRAGFGLAWPVRIPTVDPAGRGASRRLSTRVPIPCLDRRRRVYSDHLLPPSVGRIRYLELDQPRLARPAPDQNHSSGVLYGLRRSRNAGDALAVLRRLAGLLRAGRTLPGHGRGRVDEVAG